MRRRDTRPGLLALGILAACSTDDVTTDPPDTRNLFQIPDDAFGEYLQYREVPGIVENDDSAANRFALDIDAVDEVTELNLSKTSGAVMDLVTAGLETAEEDIRDLDGIQFFTGLQTLTITSNAITELDLSQLVLLNELEMNFNLVGSLDLSENVSLEILRYRASSSATENQRLDTLDLSTNTALRHLFLPGHDLVGIDLTANTAIDQVLDLSDNPGPDGDRETPDIVVPAMIFDQVPEAMRAGVTSDADAPVQLSLRVMPSSLSEAGAMATLQANLNRTSSVAVSLNLRTDGTAVLDEDYSIASTMLVVPSGMTSAQTTITTIDDMDQGGELTLQIEAVDIMGAQGANVVVELTITDDDGMLPLILNEVLYDPPDAGDGDANADGGRDPNEDEFVELVNDSNMVVDVSGLAFFDVDAMDMGMPRHVVPNGTMLMPRQALVVFGGGSPSGDFGGAVVQTANGFENRLNLNNSSDFLTVQDAGGAVIFTFDVEALSNNPNESYTRAPDLTGDFEQHAGVVEGILFSPGTRADGSSF